MQSNEKKSSQQKPNAEKNNLNVKKEEKEEEVKAEAEFDLDRPVTRPGEREHFNTYFLAFIKGVKIKFRHDRGQRAPKMDGEGGFAAA